MILVDGIQAHETSLRHKRWSHMVSTTGLDELHEMADLLGLKRSWFQPRSFAHYDVVPTKRLRAIQLGALEVDARLLLFCNFDYAIKRPDRVVPEPYASRVREAHAQWGVLRDERLRAHVAACGACRREALLANVRPSAATMLCAIGRRIWRS